MFKYIKLSLLATLVVFFVIPNLAFATITWAQPGDIPTPDAGGSCTDLQYNLTYKKSKDSNTNGEVSDLQSFLQEQGLLNSEPTGYFGALTFSAVKAFQTQNNLAAYGYVGSMTRAAIKDVSCNGSTVVTDPTPGFACTQEMRLCPDGSAMPRDANCGWHSELCTSNTGSSTSNVPTVEFVGKPTLRLKYDSAGKESVLEGKAMVRITIGNEAVTLNSNSVAALLRFTNQAGTGGVYTNGMNFSAITLQSYSTSTFPANTSVIFSITNTVKTSELFAGLYIMAPTTMYYVGQDNNGHEVSSADFKNAQNSNSVRIIGETSPYITSIKLHPKAESGDYYIINGSRFSYTSNSLTINGITKISGIDASGVGGPSITFSARDFNLSSGVTYVVQVSTNKGASNNFSFTTSGSETQPASALTVTFPQTGMTFIQDQPMTISWTGMNSDASYALTLKYPTTSGTKLIDRVIGRYSAAQAHCDAADKCYISWTPNYSASNVSVIVADSVSGRYGTSGTFTISSDALSQSSLANPTLSPSSPVSQFVVGGTSQKIVILKLATTAGQANVSDLRFSLIGQEGIQSISVGYTGISGTSEFKSAPYISSTVDISGLNIPITTGGVDIPVTVKYSGFQNSSTGGNLVGGISNVQVALNYIKAISSSGQVITNATTVSSNPMSLVASKPTVTMASGDGSAPLVLGAENKIAEFTVMADKGGNIGLSSTALSVATQGITNPQISNLRITGGNTPISGASITGSSTMVVRFANLYEISAGQSKTFSVYGKVDGMQTSPALKSYTSTRFSSEANSGASMFKWVDVIGGNNQYTEDKILNFPTNSYTTNPSGTQPAPTITVSPSSINKNFSTNENVEIGFIATNNNFTGSGSFTWDVGGNIPSELILSKEGAFYAVLRGTPTQPGDYSFVVRASHPAAPGVYADVPVTLKITSPTQISNVPTVYSPNGGETWTLKTSQKISWKNTIPTYPSCPVGSKCPTFMQPKQKAYDIYLVPQTPKCPVGAMCQQIIQAPMKVASGINGSSYNWSVGSYIPDYMTNNMGGGSGSTGSGTVGSGGSGGGIIGSGSMYANPGTYQIQVCEAGKTATMNCDFSDDYFKIINSSTEGSVIYYPNGGDTIVIGNTPPNTLSVSFRPVYNKKSSFSLNASNGDSYGLLLVDNSNYILGIAADKQSANVQLPADWINTHGSQYKVTVCTDSVCDSSDNYFTITKSNTVEVSPTSAELIGNVATYTPAQTIRFSLKGMDSTGKIATPAQGLHVQSNMYYSDTGDGVMVDGTYQSVNAEYNYTTSAWDITMKAPSDNTRSYKINTIFYCSSSYLGCGPAKVGVPGYDGMGQISKVFEFKLSNNVLVPTIKVLYPNGNGEVFKVGDSVLIRWSTSNLPTNNDVKVGLQLSFITDSGETYEDGMTTEILSANLGAYNWVIPDQYRSGKKIDKYKVRAYLYGNSIVGTNPPQDYSDNYFTITNSAPVVTSISPTSAELVGIVGLYTPGQTIRFSLKGMDSTGSIATPAQGLHVQSYMRDSIGNDPNTFETTKVNGVYQSVNGEYNYNTNSWDIVLTAPSDNIKKHTIFAVFYCSNSNLGCGPAKVGVPGYDGMGQISKSFEFTVTGTTSVSLTPPQITSPTEMYVSQSETQNQTITWNAVSGATKYRVVIDNLPYQDIGNTTSFGFNVKVGLPTSLSTVGTHIFNLQACNSNGSNCSVNSIVTINIITPIPTMCDYPNPPTGCNYGPGPNYDPATGCGAILMCQAPPAPAVSNNKPTGFVDVASSGDVGACGMVAGWAFDADKSSASTEINIYLDGPAGSGTGYNAGDTNALRPDVNAAYNITGNHGYNFPIPGLSSGSHTAYVYSHGVDTAGNKFSEPVLLTNSPISFSCASNVSRSASKVSSLTQKSAVLGDYTMCVDIPYNMHRGYEDNNVKNLQSFFIEKGLLSDTPTGFYGDKTVQAVKDYQAMKGLPQTGMVYDFTRSAIKAESCK